MRRPQASEINSLVGRALHRSYPTQTIRRWSEGEGWWKEVKGKVRTRENGLWIRKNTQLNETDIPDYV